MCSLCQAKGCQQANNHQLPVLIINRMETLDKWVGAQPMPFTKVGQKFNQETFYGRWRYFMDLINPLSLLYSVDEVKRATSELPRGQRYNARGHNRAVELQANSELTTTEKPVPFIFRMSAYLPVNIPILSPAHFGILRANAITRALTTAAGICPNPRVNRN